MHPTWPIVRRLLKSALALGIAGFASLVLLIAIFDFRYIQPRLPAMHRILADASRENRHPPAVIRQLLTTTHRGSSTSYQVYRLISYRIGDDGPRRFPWRQMKEILWSKLLQVHFDAEAIDALYCTLEYNGQDYGADQLAQRLYSKPLGQLSPEEAATVVAIFRAPRRMLDDQVSRERIRDHLLAEMKASSAH